MGYIYRRENLHNKEQYELERQQFNDLDMADQKLLYDSRARMGDDFVENPQLCFLDPDQIEIKKGQVRLRVYDVCSLIVRSITEDKSPINSALSDNIVDQYTNLICDYVNDIRRNKPGSQVLPETNPAKESSKHLYLSREHEPPCTTPPEEYFPSCRILHRDTFSDIEKQTNGLTYAEEAAKILGDMNCTGDNFHNLDYLFIPLNEEERGHWTLLGLAIKQKYAFHIDSLKGGKPPDVTSFPAKGLMALILTQIPETETWPYYGEYANDPDETFDGSPNCCVQGDWHNCGVFTSTNMFCLAFGFDLTCYRQRHLNSLKRPRMFAELHNAYFSGKFAYDMLDISPRPEFGTPRIRPVPLDTWDNVVEQDVQDHVVEEEVQDSNEGPKWPLSAPRTDAEDDEDLEEQRGLGSSGAKSKGPLTFESLILKEMLRESSEPGIPTGGIQFSRGYRNESQMECRLYPLQFDPKYFRKTGFLYEGDILKRYGLNKLDKSQLLPLFRGSPIPNEELVLWYKESNEVFRKWAENRILAVLAILRSESTKPLAGLAGNANWYIRFWEAERLRQHKRKEKGSSALA